MDRGYLKSIGIFVDVRDDSDYVRSRLLARLIYKPIEELNYSALRVRAYLKLDIIKTKAHIQDAIKLCFKIDKPSRARKRIAQAQEIAARDWYIFTTYTGLPGGPTMKEIGDQFEISASSVRNRIYRLEKSYLRTLKNLKWATRVTLVAEESWTPKQQYAEFAELISE